MLRELECRRELLVARSAALRGEIHAVVAPIARTLSAADRVIAGVEGMLRWALRLAPLYSLLRRGRKESGLRPRT